MKARLKFMTLEHDGRIPVLVIGSRDEPTIRAFIEKSESDQFARDNLAWTVTRWDQVSLEALQESRIIVTTFFNAEWLRNTRHLEWIQFMGAGLDRSIPSELKTSGIIITNASGVHEVPISEHLIGMMLMFSRQLHRCMRQQISHEWNREGFEDQLTELFESTVGIIGLGAIGEGLAKRCKALGMRVLATRRHPERGSEHIDSMLPPERLLELLSQSDYVVISTPLTAETQGMIGETELRQMKPNAILLNIARGKIVDQDALIRALRERRIAGAGLDVTDPEPLPEDSPLWDMHNVIISPHISGLNPHYGRRAAEIFLHNLHAIVEGSADKMINLVDRELWY